MRRQASNAVYAWISWLLQNNWALAKKNVSTGGVMINNY